jgi:thiamine biosynthesis lipoprotein
MNTFKHHRYQGIIRAIGTAMLAACLATSCAAKPMDRAELVLGTVCSIRIQDGGSGKALDAVFARLKEIDAGMSANSADSVIAAINEAAGISPVPAPEDLRYVISRALHYAKLSGGAFDPTIGPIVKLWNIGMDGERVPGAAEIREALKLVDYRDVILDDTAGTVFLRRPGMRIDLGAIAKGYAADEVERVLLKYRVKGAVIDLGGNVKVSGRKPDGSKWRIGIQNPFDDRGDRLGIATLEGGYTVVTSGVYERYFIGENDEHYHHILGTRTGYPVNNGLVSVTILCKSSVDADGLSTSVFALGLQAGMALVESLPEIEAVFVDGDKKVYMSPGAKAVFRLDDPAFTLAEPPALPAGK